MKQFWLLLISIASLLSLPGRADAAPVKPEKARQVALGVLASPVGTRSGQPALELVWDGESAATRSNSDPAFYVFNRTDAPGFVIVAGDDAAVPLLGYSSEGKFRREGMPANVQAWFRAVRETILTARERGLPPLPAWRNAASSRTGNVVRQLATALWNQTPPFNDDCPLYQGQRTLTGCVATAAAIVMHYNRWPDHGIGVVPAYTTRTYSIHVPERVLKPYDYDLMLERYDNGYTPAQAAETARLIADAGSICSIDYGLEATGAYTSDLLTGLITYMRYSKAASLAYKESYSDREWIALMKREVEANRPVLYAGDNGEAGHQFVLDGYDDQDYFHFNWGWGGYDNGWFYIGGAGFEFVFNQCAIVDLEKDPDGTTTRLSDLKFYPYTNEKGVEYRGLTTDAQTIRQNVPFEVLAGAYGNFGPDVFTGTVKLTVCDAAGELKEDVSEVFPIVGLPSMMMTAPDGTLTCRITGRIAAGDRIRAFYKADDESQWRILRRYTEGMQDEIVLTPQIDKDYIAAQSTFAYDRTARRIVLSTCENADVTLTGPNGATLFDEHTVTGKVDIAVSMFGKGIYTLSIGVADAEPFALQVVL